MMYLLIATYEGLSCMTDQMSQQLKLFIFLTIVLLHPLTIRGTFSWMEMLALWLEILVSEGPFLPSCFSSCLHGWDWWRNRPCTRNVLHVVANGMP